MEAQMSMENILKRCRLCLNMCSNATSIFENGLPEMIFLLTQLKMNYNDLLPNFACLDCAFQVQQAMCLRQKILQSHKQLLDEIKKKLEIKADNRTKSSTEAGSVVLSNSPNIFIIATQPSLNNPPVVLLQNAKQIESPSAEEAHVSGLQVRKRKKIQVEQEETISIEPLCDTGTENTMADCSYSNNNDAIKIEIDCPEESLVESLDDGKFANANDMVCNNDGGYCSIETEAVEIKSSNDGFDDEDESSEYNSVSNKKYVLYFEHDGHSYLASRKSITKGWYFKCKYYKTQFCKASAKGGPGGITCVIKGHNHPAQKDYTGSFRIKMRERPMSEFISLRQIYEDEATRMSTRSRKLVSLANREDKEIFNHTLYRSRSESIKTRSTTKMSRCLEIVDNGNLATKKITRGKGNKELMSKTVPQMPSDETATQLESLKMYTKDLPSEIVCSEPIILVPSKRVVLQNSIGFEKLSNEADDFKPEHPNTANSLQELNNFTSSMVPQVGLNDNDMDFANLSREGKVSLNEDDFSLENNHLKYSINNQSEELHEEVDIKLEPPPLAFFKPAQTNSPEKRKSLSLQPNQILNYITEENTKENKKAANYRNLSVDQGIDPYSDSNGDEYVPTKVSGTSTTDGAEDSSTDLWPSAPSQNTLKISQVEKSRKKVKHLPLITTREKEISFNCSVDSDGDRSVTVTCSAKINGKRIRDKRYCCFICQKNILNLHRHLISMHSNDKAIARILALPKNSKCRRDEFGKLMRTGNFYHNCEVLHSKKGELILLRRPTLLEQKKYTYINYGPCPDCLGFMLKKNISHHMKINCTSKSRADLGNRKPISESNALLFGMYDHNPTADFIDNILNRMRYDEITKICKKDNLILKFGIMMYEKYSTTKSELIRQSMRQLGRFFIELNKAHPQIKSLGDSLKPQYFDLIVQVVKRLCDTQSGDATRIECKTPSLALKIGHAIKRCANFERGNALRSADVKKNQELESFQKIMDLEWRTRISSNALNTLDTRKFNCAQRLMTVDSGEANKFAGKKLDDIELSDLPHVEMEEDDIELDDLGDMDRGRIEKPNKTTAIKKEAPKRKMFTKIIWTEKEIAAVLKFFASFIKTGTLPGKAKCEECMTEYPVFGTRKWTDLKFYVKNYINKLKRLNKKALLT